MKGRRSFMGRFRILIALVLVLTAAAGCSRGSTGKSATTAPPASDGLRIRAAAGDQASYHTTIKTAFSGRSLNGNALPADLPLTGKTACEYDARLKFEQVDGDQATISYALSGFTLRTEVGGKELPVPASATGDMRFVMKVNLATGRLLDIDLGPGWIGILDKRQLMKAMEQTFVQLPPETEVKPGSNWTAETPLPLDLPGIKAESKIVVTTKYEADETRDGAEVARLVTTGTGPVTISGEAEGVSFTLRGNLEMRGVQYVDRKTGLPQAVESRTALTFTQSMKDLTSGLSVEMEIETVSEISMVRK